MAPTSRNDANGRCHGDASAGIDELGDLDRDCCTIRRRLTCGADRWRCHRPSKHGGVRPSSIEWSWRCGSLGRPVTGVSGNNSATLGNPPCHSIP